VIYIILALLIGYYLGNSSQRREDIKKVVDLVEKTKSHKYTIIKAKPKKEPENVPQI